MKSIKQNIRYLGFEDHGNGGRKFDFSITTPGQAATRVSLYIPGLVFTGVNRVSYQESAKICYEKLRVLLEQDQLRDRSRIDLTVEDIARFRHVPRGKSRSQTTT